MSADAKKAGSQPAIVIRNVSKEFVIPHERRTTLFENLAGAFRPATYERFVALQDINITVERGEALGIIGDNGSGKSTLLKILSQILRPTTGSVEINGKITPFLELGVGFQPDLTARENIEVYSTIMGLSGREVSKNLDHVLDFAGLTKFRDTKLKNFSSGMQVRLAFATAIQTTPDILIVDEVLAVGDMDFQQKCLEVFTEYRKRGVTIIFVSHDLSAVRRFCDKAVLLKGGRQLAYGKTAEIIDRYIYGIDKAETMAGSANVEPTGSLIESSDPAPEVPASAVASDRWGNSKIAITGVRLIDKYGGECDRFSSGDPLKIQISYHSAEAVDDCVFGIAIYSDNDMLCYGTNSDIEKVELGGLSADGIVEIYLPSIPFLYGTYRLTVAAHSKSNVTYDWHDKKYSFAVMNTCQRIGLVDLKSSWSVGGGEGSIHK